MCEKDFRCLWANWFKIQYRILTNGEEYNVQIRVGHKKSWHNFEDNYSYSFWKDIVDWRKGGGAFSNGVPFPTPFVSEEECEKWMQTWYGEKAERIREWRKI